MIPAKVVRHQPCHRILFTTASSAEVNNRQLTNLPKTLAIRPPIDDAMLQSNAKFVVLHAALTNRINSSGSTRPSLKKGGT